MTPTLLVIYQDNKLASEAVNQLLGGSLGGIAIYNDLLRMFSLECNQFIQMKNDLIFEEELELEACDPDMKEYLPRLGLHFLDP